MPIVLDGTQGISTPMYAGSISSNPVTPSVNMKNRIINGNCVIDQRNAGASVAITTAAPFITDRFFSYASQTSKLTAQQNAGAVTPPVGFSNYLGHTSQSTYAITASDLFVTAQRIEGFNTADLGWGTANAKTVTLSFQVYSSLTGTFGGSLQNSAQNRSYPFTYSIPSANTWTTISITIAGDTSGTWIGATNGIGIQLNFGLGIGSTYSTTASAWAAGNYFAPTGATSVVGTNGATFYITGVQLEVGSTATSFDYRPYGTELQLCQRYYFQITPNGTQYSAYASGHAPTTTDISLLFKYPVPPRTACTGITASGTATWIVQQSTNLFNPTITFVRANQTNITANAALTGATANAGANLIDGNNASFIQFNGMEL